MVARVLVALLVAFAIAGCSSPTKEGARAAIHGSTYEPATITIRLGEHAHFDNHDSVEHSVTSDSVGAFSTDIEGGKGGDVQPAKTGTFPFHCKYHPQMHGTLVVQ